MGIGHNHRNCKGIRGIFYLFDFDGTLSPIVNDPDKARFPQKAKKLIEALAHDKHSRIAIVTGRAYNDIFRKVGLTNIYYAANHGLEIYKGRKRLLIKGAHFEKKIKYISKMVKNAVSGIKGVIIQEKGLSLSIHFRMVAKDKRRELIKRITAATKKPLKKAGLDIHGGKMVLEISPRASWNKGDASLWLCKKFGKGYLPFYIGDDTTDEDAFKVINRIGIAARVGYKKGTHASHILKDPLY